jgi:hypothetical protein
MSGKKVYVLEGKSPKREDEYDFQNRKYFELFKDIATNFAFLLASNSGEIEQNLQRGLPYSLSFNIGETKITVDDVLHEDDLHALNELLEIPLIANQLNEQNKHLYQKAKSATDSYRFYKHLLEKSLGQDKLRILDAYSETGSDTLHVLNLQDLTGMEIGVVKRNCAYLKRKGILEPVHEPGKRKIDYYRLSKVSNDYASGESDELIFNLLSVKDETETGPKEPVTDEY